MNTLLSNAFESCKGTIEIGWIQDTGMEVILFINNADSDISQCVNMVESIGGRIEVLDGNDSSGIRVELTFPSKA